MKPTHEAKRWCKILYYKKLYKKKKKKILPKLFHCNSGWLELRLLGDVVLRRIGTLANDVQYVSCTCRFFLLRFGILLFTWRTEGRLVLSLPPYQSKCYLWGLQQSQLVSLCSRPECRQAVPAVNMRADLVKSVNLAAGARERRWRATSRPRRLCDGWSPGAKPRLCCE